MSEIKRVLLIYTDPYYLVKQVYPFGLDILASRLRNEGVEARIEHAFLPGPNPLENLSKVLSGWKPDLVGLGIRNIDTCMACEDHGDVLGPGFRSFFFLPRIRAVASAVRELLPEVPVICGGGGFTVAPAEILKYLEAPYGIVGEGEESLAEFVKAWPGMERIKAIPGLVMHDKGTVEANPRRRFSFPARQDPGRDAGFMHAFESAGLPMRVKRGCNQACSFCVEPLLECRSFSYRPIPDVIAELEAAASLEHVNKVFFVDTAFNVPNLKYGTELVSALADAGLPSRFRFASQFIPRPFDDDFTRLLADAGFAVIMTCTSFADEVLAKNRASFREAHIMRALELCEKHGLDVTVDLIFGLPGETMETVEHSLSRMHELPDAPLRHYEYTVGARIYPGTPLAEMAREMNWEQVYGDTSQGLLEPCFYCSPLPPLELKAVVDEKAPEPMRFDNELSEAARARLAVNYLADRRRFEEAYDAYLALPLADKSRVFDYFFRSMAEAGHAGAARMAALHLKEAIGKDGSSEYRHSLGLIDFYLNILERAGM
jgi:radical SAM superfamily enzyme YgiQ (UPF0313 family)